MDSTTPAADQAAAPIDTAVAASLPGAPTNPVQVDTEPAATDTFVTGPVDTDADPLDPPVVTDPPLVDDADANTIIAADIVRIGAAFDEVAAIAAQLRTQVNGLLATQPAGVNVAALSALADRLDSAAQSAQAASTPAAAVAGTAAGDTLTTTATGLPAQIGGVVPAALTNSTENPDVMSLAPGSVAVPGTASTVGDSTDVTAAAETSAAPTPTDTAESAPVLPVADSGVGSPVPTDADPTQVSGVTLPDTSVPSDVSPSTDSALTDDGPGRHEAPADGAVPDAGTDPLVTTN